MVGVGLVVGGAAYRYGLLYHTVQVFQINGRQAAVSAAGAVLPDGRLDEVRKEIRELKEEIGKMKKT